MIDERAALVQLKAAKKRDKGTLQNKCTFLLERAHARTLSHTHTHKHAGIHAKRKNKVLALVCSTPKRLVLSLRMS